MSTSTLLRRGVAALLVVSTAGFVGAAPAGADHVHSKQTGNGDCVLLARNGGEGRVALPFADSSQVRSHRAHPLHLLVHKGRPGGNFEIGVYGTASDPCYDGGGYVND